MKESLLRRTQVFVAVLGQLWRTPLATLLTVAVIGISLAFPAGLYVAVRNAQYLAARWDHTSDISLFLKHAVKDQEARGLSASIQKMPGVAGVQVIGRDAAFEEFKRYSGFGAALDRLESNPLPIVLIVRPGEKVRAPAELEALVKRLATDSRVEIAQLDVEWVRRLEAILHIAERLVLILASLLAVAVVVIVGNTIRLAVLNRRDEIEVTKLVGATSSFVRRPFLYSGALQGALGGGAAWLLVFIAIGLLTGPLTRLGGLYGRPISIEGLGFSLGLGLVLVGGALGWIGSRLAVGRHLRQIEPK